MQITQNDLISTKTKDFLLEQSDRAVTPNTPVQHCTGPNKLTSLNNGVPSLTAGGGYDDNSNDGKEIIKVELILCISDVRDFTA